MVARTGATRWPGAKKEAPRELGPSAAAPRPDERELEVVIFKHTEQGDGLQTTAAELDGIWREKRLLAPDDSRIEGWVAGVPVVGGVADSGWQERLGGRVRLQVRVVSCPDQKEWVWAMAYGGAYGREILRRVG